MKTLIDRSQAEFAATENWLPHVSIETKSLLTVIAFSLVVIAPVWFFGIPSNRDLLNHFRFALPFYDSIRSGHLYPGWLAESNGGFGDASFRFYPPALYYLLSLTRAITGDWYRATLLTFSLVSVFGGVGVYFWSRSFLSPMNSAWASILYALAPYHLNQLYQAFMVAEYAGAAVLPFAFWFVERVCRYRRVRDAAGLGAAYSLLILTHLPLAVIGSLSLLTYALFRLEPVYRLKTLFLLVFGVGLGLAASACYWTTMVTELNWIWADRIQPDPSINYRDNFVLSTLSPDYLNVWWTNILLLGSVALFWPALALYWSRKNEPSNHKRTLMSTAAVLSLSLFMAVPLSRPIWHLFSTLQATQFPWRWLTITSLAAPVLLASSLPYWKRIATGNKRPLVVVAVGTMLVSVAFSASHTVREANFLSSRVFDQTLKDIPGSPGISQWWPVWVQGPLPKMTQPVEAGERAVTVSSWNPEERVFRVGPGVAAQARVRTFYYPHWKAFSEGKSLSLRPDRDGTLLIDIPPDALEVTMKFQEPSRVRFAAITSLIGCLVIAGLFLKPKKILDGPSLS